MPTETASFLTPTSVSKDFKFVRRAFWSKKKVMAFGIAFPHLQEPLAPMVGIQHHMPVCFVSCECCKCFFHGDILKKLEPLQLEILDCFHDWFLDCNSGSTAPVNLYPFGLVLETCTSELAVHVHLKIALMDFMVLDFVRQDLYMWSVYIFLYM